MVSTSERMVRGMAQKLLQFCYAPTTLSDVVTESVECPECDSFSVDARQVDNSTVLQYMLNNLTVLQ